MNATSRSAPPFRVIDASAVVELLIVSERADAVERVVEDACLVAPDSINPEVLQAIRRLERANALGGRRADEMLARFVRMPIFRVPTVHLLRRAWGMRANLSAYDACYVALAYRLRSQLITGDHRLSRAPNLGVPLVLV